MFVLETLTPSVWMCKTCKQFSCRLIIKRPSSFVTCVWERKREKITFYKFNSMGRNWQLSSTMCLWIYKYTSCVLKHNSYYIKRRHLHATLKDRACTEKGGSGYKILNIRTHALMCMIFYSSINSNLITNLSY